MTEYNFDFEELLIKRFTAAELVEFLCLEVEDIIEAFPKHIHGNLSELLEETNCD